MNARKKQFRWILLAASLVAGPSAFAQYEGLVINEILPSPTNAAGVYFDSNQDGAASSIDDEFIELLNTSATEIDVAGLWIADANTNIRRHVFSARILPPGGSIVVFGGGSLLNFSNPPAQIATGSGLSLNNDTETVTLFSPQTAVVDQVSYQLTASHNAISVTRNPDGAGGFTNHYVVTTNAARASPGRQLHGQPFLTNRPPVFVDLPNQTAFVGLELQFPVRAYDPADRDAVALSALNLPANSALSATGGVGTFSFTAAPDQAGQTFDVSLVAGDKDGTETNTIAVQVINPNSAEDVWINEIHYDNDGVDSDEGVEIAGTAGSVLSDYALVFYNGNDGKIYDGTNALAGTLDDEQCGYGAAWFGHVGIQNETEGIALVKGSSVVQFLSYEGALTASNGPAAGMTSVDIGVRETAATAGYSLQLTGTGTTYSAFAWASARPHSRGTLNTGQEITCLAPAAIDIQKTVYLGHDGGASAPGVESVQGTNAAAVTYVFRVSNTGGCALTNVWITDAALGIPPIDLGTLTTGAVSTSHIEAVISGDLRNTATVTGYGPDGASVADDDTAEVVEFIPSIDIQLTVYRGQDGGAGCPGSSFLQATNGTPVTFCLIVENNGTTNVNALSVSADSLGIAPIGIGTLGTGGMFATSVAAVVTASLAHVATVSGTDPNGDPLGDQDSAAVEIIHPALQLQKTVYLGHDGGLSCPGSELATDTNGAPITYCFRIANIGDATLTNVTLSDPDLPGFSDTALGTLATGETASLFFESILVADHVNTATATALSAIGTLVQAEDSAAVSLATPPDPPAGNYEFDVVDLGTLGGNASGALAINDRSQVVGWALDDLGQTQAFLWQGGGLTGLGFLPGEFYSMANAINNNGDIVGFSYVGPTAQHAFLCRSNSLEDLGTLGGTRSVARGINERGEVTGWALLTNSTDPHAFFWSTNQFVNIPPFHGWYSSEGNDINESGALCGVTFLWATSYSWWGFVWIDLNGNRLHDDGEMQLLGSLGVTYTAGSGSRADAINDSGQVVGWTCITNLDYPRHAFLVTPRNGQWKIPAGAPITSNSLMQSLGVLGGPTNNSWARDINNETWIVGTADLPSGTNQAFLWRYGAMENLNDLIATNSGWVLTEAAGINEHNEIVGSGLHHGQPRAFLLRQGGRITHVDKIVQTTNFWVYTNEFDEVVTQTVEEIQTHVLQWAGIWGTNANASHVFTVEYCDALQDHVWKPFYPTNQWPAANNIWTNSDYGAVSMRFFRVRAK